MFCQKCGNQVGDNERFCGNCGAPLTVQPVQQEAQPAPYPQPEFTYPPQSAYPASDVSFPQPNDDLPTMPAQDHPVQAAYPQQDMAYPQDAYSQDYASLASGKKPKKDKKPMTKKKKWILIGSIAGAVAVLTAVFFIFIFPLFFRGGNSSMLVFSAGGKDYYTTPDIVKLNGDKGPDLVLADGGDRDGMPQWIDYRRSALIGKTIYACKGSYGPAECLKKYEFSSDTALKESEWVSEDTIKNCVFAKLNAEKNEYSENWVTALYHFQSDGKYVYFTLVPGAEHAMTQGNIRGRVGRISTDGKTIEQVGEINARDIVVDGGWIYYFDDGYYFSEKTGLIGRRNAGDVGIYKCKTDGSGKTLLHSFSLSSEQKDTYSEPLNDISGNLQMIKGKLYFVDYTADGRGRLCRMNKNGGGFEYISESAVSFYAIDTDHNVAYYEATTNDAFGPYMQLSIEPHFKKYSIGSHYETDIDFVKMSFQDACYHKGYVYFINGSIMPVDGKNIALRMNVNSGDFEWLKYHDESKEEFVADPDTGVKRYKRTDGKQYVTWEKAETK